MYRLSKLHNLFSEKEENNLLEKIPQNQTYLWKHWEEFLTMSLRSRRSQIYLSWIYDSMKSFIKDTLLRTIESFDNPHLLTNEFHRMMSERNWSPVTFNTHRKNLNSYFLHLKRMKYIKDNPINSIQKLKEDNKAQAIINDYQIHELLNLLRNDTSFEWLRNLLYFEIAILTWARPIEILNLNLNSFSSNRDEIRISWAKQNSKARIYDTKNIKNTLSNYLKIVSKSGRSRELNEYLFLSATTNWAPLTTNGVNKLYKRLNKKLNFKINTYMIRRFVATDMYKNWANIYEVMDFLWHTRLATAKKYIQNSSEFTKKWTDMMSRFLVESYN